MEADDEFWFFFIMAVVLFVYLLPTTVACVRLHRRMGAIMLVNIFLGWTFVGWWWAMIWSVMAEAHPTRARTDY